MASPLAPGTVTLVRGGESLLFPIVHATAVDVTVDGRVGCRLDLRAQEWPVIFGGEYFGWDMAPQVEFIVWGWTVATVQAGDTVVQPGYDADRAEYDGTIYTGQHQTLEQNTLTIVRRDRYGLDVHWIATIEDINDPIHEPMNTLTIQARFSWD